MMEELQEIDNIQEESNVIDIKKPKRPTWYLERYINIPHLFTKVGYLHQIVDLYCETASDKELFVCMKSLSPNLPVSYPEGFTREIALNVIKNLKVENPVLVANYGIGLLNEYARISQDIGFVFKNNQIHCMFMFHEDEPKHSGYIIIALRGSQIEKSRAAASFLKLWYNSYQRHWYDKGYRYIWANSFTPKGKEFIRHAGAKEPNHVFFSRQANHSVRWNGKYHWLMDYRWDLEKKYGS